MHLNPQAGGKNLKKSLMKSAYDEFEEKDFREIIEEKDLFIRRLEFKIEKLEKQNYELLGRSNLEGGVNDYYKDKLAQQIKSNETAVNLILSISHKLNKMIVMFRESAGFSQESTQVKELLNIMGHQDEGSMLSSSVYTESEESSLMDNIASINLEAQKISDELCIVCEAFHQNYLKLQKERVGLDKKYKEDMKIAKQEIANLNKELSTTRLSKEKLKQLLEKNETEMGHLMGQIAAILTPDYQKSLQSMDKVQLINEIKKILFKNKELETSKVQVIKENQKIKASEMEKYKKILLQVKQVREMSRLGKSSF